MVSVLAASAAVLIVGLAFFLIGLILGGALRKHNVVVTERKVVVQRHEHRHQVVDNGARRAFQSLQKEVRAMQPTNAAYAVPSNPAAPMTHPR